MHQALANKSAAKGRARGWLLLVLIGTCVGGCSEPEPTFTGIWKSRCTDFWGVQIMPASEALYAVTFCGLSGCLAPGTWAPDSSIKGDPRYQIVSLTTLRIKRSDGGFFTYQKCNANPHWTGRPYLGSDK